MNDQIKALEARVTAAKADLMAAERAVHDALVAGSSIKVGDVVEVTSHRGATSVYEVTDITTSRWSSALGYHGKKRLKNGSFGMAKHAITGRTISKVPA